MDKRTKHTKAVLRRSLLSLMQEKNLQRITVKELCVRAEVNRSTFYAYYKSPSDLLEKIQSELYSSMEAALRDNFSARGNLSMLTEALKVCSENGDALRVMLDHSGSQDFIKTVLDIGRKRSFDEWERMTGIRDEQKFEYLYTYLAFGATGVIRSWLYTGQKESAGELADMINSLAHKGLDTVLEKK